MPDATRALLDAERGFWNSTPPTNSCALSKRAPRMRVRRASGSRVDLGSPASYRGETVRLLLNIEGPESLSHPAARFADGVGLMRTEFLFRGRNEAPDEDAQFEAYSAVLRWAGERPVTIRTVDAGGDKPIPGLSEAGEANPFLGRARPAAELRRPDVFATQLRALAPRRASTGDLKVMFPMVTAPSEFEARARAVRAGRRGVEVGRAGGAPAGTRHDGRGSRRRADDRRFAAAFFSIGANDLTQYVMACDRANGAVSHSVRSDAPGGRSNSSARRRGRRGRAAEA